MIFIWLILKVRFVVMSASGFNIKETRCNRVKFNDFFTTVVPFKYYQKIDQKPYGNTSARPVAMPMRYIFVLSKTYGFIISEMQTSSELNAIYTVWKDANGLLSAHLGFIHDEKDFVTHHTIGLSLVPSSTRYIYYICYQYEIVEQFKLEPMLRNLSSVFINYVEYNRSMLRNKLRRTAALHKCFEKGAFHSRMVLIVSCVLLVTLIVMQQIIAYISDKH